MAPKKITPRLSDIIRGVRSYYIIGDIALVSPKDDINKEELAKVLLQINPRIKSVFIRKKVGGELRINELDFAGGEYKTTTIYKESGLRFKVDISKVYVNVSLSSERDRLESEVECKRVIGDLFAGYGAIAIHLARKCGYIVAGDLNIDGLVLLKESILLNKLKGSIDIVQYDAHYLPFRDKSIDIGIADNPTMISSFKDEICRVAREVIFYILCHSEEEASRYLGKTDWIKVNDYSKDLFVFKGRVRCNEEKQ
ncbi:methyltransferase domain-containing protein [Stygiolobus caldivivus]|uniref:Methyltransferase n=1 Tax=Stygiolobus caldivivus TaxID=2824673 RepID=A0A8D5ZI37_9CREN|nr:methyltransferase domain-containing protein [Stygiolobus caldivivus]BCU69256.1 methyltransferase [Stygiolobus caldivivus]